MLTLVIDHILLLPILLLLLQHTIIPEPLHGLAIPGNLPLGVHHAITPLPNLLIPVGLALLAEPMSLVVFEEAFVPAAIWPLEHAFAVDFVRVPLTFIYFVILPLLPPISVHAIIGKIAFILTAISPDHDTMT